MDNSKFRKLLPLFLCLISTTLFAENIKIESGPKKVSVIELFGSEGCSSCPPADAWLNQLKENSGLWKNFVVMSFHVDYWDKLGWKDPFSSPQSTQYQEDYARLWNSNSLYTPCMVLNGREWRSWGDSENAVLQSNENIGNLTASSDSGNRWKIIFKPAADSNKSYEAHLAYLGMGIEIKVLAGENRGRTLKHEFVVLNHDRAPMHSDGKEFSAMIETEPHLKNGIASLALVVWVSEKNNTQPLQATGGFMPS